MNEEYIVNIVQDFERCDAKCSVCKANEIINGIGIDCTFCKLLCAYKEDLSRAITEVLDKM